MQPSAPPNPVAVEVVATRPTDADNAAIAHLGRTTDRSLAPVAYLVKVRLDPLPPATSQGWALYLDDFRVPKYWQYKEGIYFKVFDPQFFSDHEGDVLRFSQDRRDFVDTGVVMPGPEQGRPLSPSDAADLPRQADVLR